jgi:DNA repair exonuclease SbcCD ATPase subunit
MTTNNFNLNLSDQILYGALANSSGFGDGSGRSSINCIADRVRTAEEEIKRIKELHRQTLQQNCETITKLAEYHYDEMSKILEEKNTLLAIFDDPEKLRLNAAVEKLLEQDHAELDCDGWAKADEYQEQVEEQEEQIAELKKEIKRIEELHRDLDWAKHLVQQEGFEIYEYQNNEDTIELAEYVALEGHGAVCIDKMKTLDPDCLLEQSCDYLEELGYELIKPTSPPRRHVELVKEYNAAEMLERTGRKPDELWTDEETKGFRVILTAHNEEARRRHEERQKKQ